LAQAHQVWYHGEANEVDVVMAKLQLSSAGMGR
jgi:hypothetical protein